MRVRACARACVHMSVCARVCKRGWQLYTLMHTCPHSRAFEGVWSVHSVHSPALYLWFWRMAWRVSKSRRLRSIGRPHKRVCIARIAGGRYLAEITKEVRHMPPHLLLSTAHF